ncbi:hypothetical protein Emed_007245 [Eimeria media]
MQSRQLAFQLSLTDANLLSRTRSYLCSAAAAAAAAAATAAAAVAALLLLLWRVYAELRCLELLLTPRGVWALLSHQHSDKQHLPTTAATAAAAAAAAATAAAAAPTAAAAAAVAAMWCQRCGSRRRSSWVWVPGCMAWLVITMPILYSRIMCVPHPACMHSYSLNELLPPAAAHAPAAAAAAAAAYAAAVAAAVAVAAADAGGEDGS